MSPHYDDPATRHRPTDREVVYREAMRLHAQGLRARDIAELYNLNPADIEALLDGTNDAGVV